LPPSKPNKPGESSTASTVRHGLTRVGTWTGVAGKKQEETHKPGASPSSQAETPEKRPGIFSRGTWGFGGKDEASHHPNDDDDDDDRRIRFTIRGAGRRLTKDDFLKEIQSLDPKARCEVIAESDAPATMKDMAKKDASRDSPGSSRVFDATKSQVAAGAEMARRRRAEVDESGSEEDSEEEQVRRKRAKGVLDLAKTQDNTKTVQSTTTSHQSSSNVIPESEAERKRREDALRGVDDITPAQRGRSRAIEEDVDFGESAAERRRREAALGLGLGSEEEEEDSDDDDTPRVPPPAALAKSRGIRFAQSPVRGRH
jgi:hypothetical protein